jgi:lipopolysaccharide biosynthesis regulator YciM
MIQDNGVFTPFQLGKAFLFFGEVDFAVRIHQRWDSTGYQIRIDFLPVISGHLILF